MAVPHFSVSIITRGSGRSALLSAAYRHCARMEFEREARIIDYTRKRGLLHEEFVIPPDAPAWLKAMICDRPIAGASEAFWNMVEDCEKRSDAQLAKDVTIALPMELSVSQNIELIRDFVESRITARGMVADWVFHDAPGNPHVHLMTTLRPLTDDGFGAKKVAVLKPDGTPMRNDSGRIVYEIWAGGLDDFNAFRDGWFACQNRHLALAGLDIRVDGRSFERQGIALTPTIHLGVNVKAVARKSDEPGQEAALGRLGQLEERRAENARRIERNPGIVLDLITREKSVFNSEDIARILHRHIDDAALFQNMMARILQHPHVLKLDRERIEFATGQCLPAKYTTRELIRLEADMLRRAVWLSRQASHGVANVTLRAALARHDHLSHEQKVAIEHLAGDARIATVIGRAGAGKTTIMRAARQAWEAAGFRVVGAALAGKAAEGLEKEAGIGARTLSSWELRWRQGRNRLDEKTVFVLDEAGMVSSRQMGALIDAVVRADAKLVLVGDPQQLQPIEAGAAFRVIADRIGYAELETIYRQGVQWMRDASLDLARGNIAEAIDAYRANGKVIGRELKADAVSNLIADWNRDYDPARSSLILAHLRRDVRMLNEMARATLIERGIIGPGSTFQTADGVRAFAPGDQIVFLKNDGSLGVMNGMLGKVIDAREGRIIAEVGSGPGRHRISVEQRFYNNVDHGYATTVHKAQGATVDRVKVLASLSLDRHLAYVAMTRHREDLTVYYGRRSFSKAGGLIPVLSRLNAKETTLDYRSGSIYAQALRFAETRGLRVVQVARSLARGRLEWTVRQKRRLADLADRLSAIGARIGLAATVTRSSPTRQTEVRPMVSGNTNYTRTVDQAVNDRLRGDPVLKTQWDEVSTRFRHVYLRPEIAFKAVDIDAILHDPMAAEQTLARLARAPESFGDLKGRTGLLASREDRSDRERALANVAPLADSIGDYLRRRGDAERRLQADELALRRQMAVEIPALSVAANAVLERVRDAIDRNDLPAGLAYALANREVKTELVAFTVLVAARFGERTFLPRAARNADCEAFERVTAGSTPAQRTEIRQAWNIMRTAQQLAAHERSVTALKQADALRLAKTRGMTLK